MARTFRQRRQMHAVAELNVTNLLDLAFVLLIIFMIATPLITAEQTVPVNLPVESQSPQTPPDPDVKFESIVVKADGSCMLGSRPVQIDRLAGELATFCGSIQASRVSHPAGCQRHRPAVHLGDGCAQEEQSLEDFLRYADE